MSIMQQIHSLWKRNTLVAQNYFFMTVLQILNMCFYIIIYPFLIQRLGQEAYGHYAFACAVLLVAIALVTFGFDLPGTQRIACHNDDTEHMGRTLSIITSAKCVVAVGVMMLLGICVVLIPKLRADYGLYAIGFGQVIATILFPQWYFQGVQRMRVVTYIQVGCKILSLPFIFLLLRSAEDVWIFMLLTTVSTLIGSLIAWGIIRWKDGIKVYWTGPSQWVEIVKEGAPFLASNLTGVAKEQGVVLLTGAFLGMGDVAIYDLANKLILIPRTIFSKFNDAFFPKLIVQSTKSQIRRLLWVETGLGLGTIVAVAVLGKWAIQILGGEVMMASYGVSVVLSFTVLSWLIAGALIYFGLIPGKKTQFVFINQILALVVTMVVSGLGLYIYHSVYALAFGIAAAGACEILFLGGVNIHYRLLR